VGEPHGPNPASACPASGKASAAAHTNTPDVLRACLPRLRTHRC
jgi:hypothetical protein